DGDALWNRHPAVAPDVKWSDDGESRAFQRLLFATLVERPRDAGPLLSLAAVKYVVLTPSFSAGGGPDYLRYNRDEIAASFRAAPYLNALYSGDGWTLFKNTTYAGHAVTVRTVTAAEPSPSVSAAASLGAG